MDFDRSNPGPIGRNKTSEEEETRYHRAYKACVSCRAKKSKRRITAEEYAAGMPCAKCRREMRPCTFTVARHGPRQKRNSVSHSHNHVDERTSLPTHTGTASDVDTSSASGAQRDPSPEIPRGPVNTDLNDPVMTTVVSNGNDALNLLFEAAQQEETGANAPRGPYTCNPNTDPSSITTSSTSLPELSDELTETWNAYRFVRMGWISAKEIVWFLEMYNHLFTSKPKGTADLAFRFYKNISPLSPILDDFYADRSNHYSLVAHEPVLTCMLLVISSRYHTLPIIGGHSRGYLIHQRLWDHFQHLLMRLVLGLEKYSKAKTRTLGTIEALLLLTEWHPRALYAPPPSDGWDSDILFTAKDQRDQDENTVENPSRTRWREDVIEPANRSDRMCWIVLSCALSLGNELGIFDEQENHDTAHLPQHERRVLQHKAWLAKLLYVYQEQLSSRLGRRSMMTPSNSHFAVYSDTSQESSDGQRRTWTSFLTAWTRLTKIVRSISDVLFPNPVTTSQIIRSGRYISITEHIQTLLSAWLKDYKDILSSDSHLASLLTLEYESTRMHTYSLGLQAILFWTLAESGDSSPGLASIQLTPTDFAYVQGVIDSTLNMLKAAHRLYEKGILRFCSTRTFLHITTASIFLLKGLSLGVSPARLRGAIEILKQVIMALKNSNPDDLHLGGRYAILLEIYMTRLEEHFVPSIRPHNIIPPDIDLAQFSDLSNPVEANQSNLVDFQNMPGLDTVDTNWLSLPLEPSVMSFGMDSFQGLQCLGNDTLDFIWNLGV